MKNNEENFDTDNQHIECNSKDDFHLTPQLYKCWINTLKKEIRSIFYTHRIDLQIPNIIIDDNGKRWGSWNSDTRTIYISKKLIVYYSWDSVIETLKHELAHLLVDEYYQGRESSPHGEEFKQACIKLGTSAKARASDADMGAPLDKRTLNTQSSSILEKIKKLLELSKSMNEHEASQAMNKANDLILKHNISMHDMHSNPEYSYRIIGKQKKRKSSEEIKICNILQEFFFVEYIITPSFDAKNNEHLSVIEILGTNENLDMAEYVFNFLLHQSDFLWERHKTLTNVKGIVHKKSYIHGVLDGFQNSLRSERQKSHSKEIIKIIDSELKTFFKLRYPKIRKTSRKGVSMDYDSYQKGKSDGQNVRIFKPLGNFKFSGLRFLTGK